MVQKKWVVLARLSIHPSDAPLVLSVVLFSWSILTTIQLRVHCVHFYYRGGHSEDSSFKLTNTPQKPCTILICISKGFSKKYGVLDMNFFPFCRIFRQDNKKEMWLIFSDAGDVFCQSLFHIRACWAYFTLVLKLFSPCHGSSTVDVTKHLTV